MGRLYRCISDNIAFCICGHPVPLGLVQPKFNEALLEMFCIDYVGTSPYISCNPSVLHHRFCANDRFLVLSSDGLYQYFSNDEVVSHVLWFMENVPEGDPAQYLVAELLCRAAKKNGVE